MVGDHRIERLIRKAEFLAVLGAKLYLLRKCRRHPFFSQALHGILYHSGGNVRQIQTDIGNLTPVTPQLAISTSCLQHPVSIF